MRSGPDLVDARHMGHSFATDADLVLPKRPCLIPELLALPIGSDGLMFVGADEHQVFRGRSARGLLLQLLPYLDGLHTLDEIAANHPAIRPADLRDVVSLLFSRGLLEDGAPTEPVPESFADVASFVGRHIDASRRHPNRSAVLKRLKAATVSIVGPAPYAGMLAAELRASGIGRVGDGDGPPVPATLTIVVSTGPTSEITAAFEPAEGARTLLVRLGRNEAHIGPFLIDGVTACPACVARVHPHPAGEPDLLRTTLWMGLASLYAFLALSELPPSLTLRGFRVQHEENGELTEATRLAVRLPGCPRCGILGEPWSPEDPRMLAWIYHCATSLPARTLLSPRDHQAHYLMEYARLARADGRLLWSVSSAPVPASAPTGDGTRPARPTTVGDNSSAPLDVVALSSLLARMAGEVAQGGQRRRLVPTGGNLGSVLLWVVAREVSGLAPGAYLYDPRRDALDFVRPVEDDTLRRALRTDAPLPECLLVGAGALATCAEKYQAFAYRLIHLDAGVALGFAHLVAGALGIHVREYGDFDLALPQSFGIANRWDVPLPTFALGVGGRAIPVSDPTLWHAGHASPALAVGTADYSFDVLPRLLDAAAMPPACPTPWPPDAGELAPAPWSHPLDRLDTILLTRRAVREFEPAPVEMHVLRQVVNAARDALGRRVVAGAPPCFVRPMLGIALAADARGGLFEADPLTGALRRRSGFDASASEECSNQRTLAAVPATLFMVGDLREALTQRGGRGYSELALHAGAAVGEAWLRATALGLVGTAAGGVIAGGLRRVAGMDGFHECPVLALHLGRPSASTRS